MKAKHVVGMSVLLLSSVTGFAEKTKVAEAEKEAEKKPEIAEVAKKKKVLHKLKVKKLEIDLQRTPQYSFSGPSSKRIDRDQRWLEIEALVEIDTITKNRFLPKLDATFTIVYEDKLAPKVNGKKTYKKLERKITFKNVNIEEGEAYVVAYIDPDTLRIITNSKRPAVRDLTGIALEVSAENMSTKNPKELRSSELFDRKLKLKEENKWWVSPAIKSSEQKILAHTETPFELARPERYPLVAKTQDSKLKH